MSHHTEERLSAAMQDIAGNRPYTPDFDQIESRGRQLQRRRLALGATGGAGFAVAAIAAVAVATTSTQAPAPNLAAPKPATSGSTAGTTANPLLVQLTSYLTTAQQPAGDATLVLRDQVFKHQKIDVWDLYADNGDLYFAKTRSALPAEVKGHHTAQEQTQGETPAEAEADRVGLQKAVAAAKDAATGDLNAARKEMALAYEPKNPKVKPDLLGPGITPSLDSDTRTMNKLIGQADVNTTDNWVWNNSMDALIAGAGSPTVRAGVLRLLGQMPEVAVKKATLKGKPVITLSAGSLATGGAAQTLTIKAGTGLPIKFVTPGEVVINYAVTRVSLADVATGKF
jgi:hypothetical protein